ETCSFLRIALTWVRTVTGSMKRRSAISKVVSPWLISSRTSHSRSVSTTPRRLRRGRRRPRSRNSSITSATRCRGRAASPSSTLRSTSGSRVGSMSLSRLAAVELAVQLAPPQLRQDLPHPRRLGQAELWRRGSVVASWLLDLTAQALHEYFKRLARARAGGHGRERGIVVFVDGHTFARGDEL